MNDTNEITQVSGSASFLGDFIWKNAEDLWGDFKHTDFGKIILPFTLLRRLECVLEPSRKAVNEAYALHKDGELDVPLILRQISQYPFFNTSEYSLATLGGTRTRQNLLDYVAHFSDNARQIFELFNFTDTVTRMDKAGVLFKITKNFASVDLHPNAVPDRAMSNLYEHLIRKFGAAVNDGAEDFMTPRDVVHLATILLLDADDDLFASSPGLIRTIHDPTCGTGGFLSDAMNHAEEYGSKYKIAPVLVPHGQELEPETYAVALSNMLLRRLPNEPGRDLSKNIKQGSTLSNDQLAGERFHYGLANPPFGKKWEKDQKAVEAEFKLGHMGRFGLGLPRINDGSMLFLMHMAKKLELPENGGGRAAIVLSGSPLFNGGAGSGESEIRRWLLSNDLVEAIIALPEQIFFRTGIATYLWILSNKKDKKRKGKVQLINATNLWESIKNEGNKRRVVSPEYQRQIADTYLSFENSEISKILDFRAFGYRRIRVLRPLRMSIQINQNTLARLVEEKAFAKLSESERSAWLECLKPHEGSTSPYAWAEQFVKDTCAKHPDTFKFSKTLAKAFINGLGVKDENGEAVLDADGSPIADTDLTDYENVPLLDSIDDYFAREVLPHVPDAWIDNTFIDELDRETGRVGFEINFNKFFYEYKAPRSLSQIDADLKQVEDEINALLNEVTE